VGIFRTRVGVFICRSPQFLENVGFFEIYGVSARTRGLSSADREGGSIFRDFVRMSFLDGP